MKIYLAAPLFSEAEQDWLRGLKSQLRELGYASAKGIPAVGIRTDARHCGETPDARVNAMIAGSMPICLTRQELIGRIRNRKSG